MPSGVYKRTEKARQNMSLAAQGRKLSPEHIMKLRKGRKEHIRTPEEIEKHKLACQERSRNPKYLQKLSDGVKKSRTPEFNRMMKEKLKGLVFSSQQKLKISDAMKELWQDTEYRINHLRKQRKTCNTEEWKKRQSLIIKGSMTPEIRERISKANVNFVLSGGRYHKNKNIKYKGIFLRSSWEKKFAQWLDKNEIEWQYESFQYKISDGTRYIPDFYLPQFDLYVEVKGYLTEKAKTKMNEFVNADHALYIIDKTNIENISLQKRWIPC